MSLLLEALKKAELAKQSAAQAAEETASSAAESASGIALEPESERIEPVFTREKLPDITQPLQILSEDLPSAQRRAEEPPPAVQAQEPPPEPAREPPPAAAAIRAAARGTMPQPDADREAARQLFEAKEISYNPKRPFYISLGLLGAIGVGYGGYVWWQMQPRYAFNAAAVQSAGKAAPSQQAQAPAIAGAAPAQTTPSAAPAPAAPGAGAVQAPAVETAPSPRPVPPPAQAPAQQPLARAAAPESAPAAGPVLRPSVPARAGAGAQTSDARGARTPPIAVSAPALAADADLERAWEDYQRGNAAGARAAYQRILEREPNNRDALLGLAAIDLRAGNYEGAELRYQRLLDLDPRDAIAQAGLIGLRGQIDPVQAESRIKSLIAVQPDATYLYFTLGNQYALQSRWPEAQQAYFKAYSADPGNADYAFNLAVSLDQLRQKNAALQYYQRSLALAEGQPASFDRPQVADRIAELQRQ